jgi:hypothetical protein
MVEPDVVSTSAAPGEDVGPALNGSTQHFLQEPRFGGAKFWKPLSNGLNGAIVLG